MTKQRQLEQLNSEWEKKNLPLKAGAKQAVPGVGNPDADIMFIGEAPGAKEDELGEPFVGAAGKFLEELLQSIGLTREVIFIANVIKHRPPNNRDPLPEEIAQYKPWLDEQIKIIQPEIVITLGRFSMDFMLGGSFSISQIHGQPKRRQDGLVVIPMYHPAAALYNGGLRPVLMEDFARIPAIIAKLQEDQ